jgi:hypothetical protein
MTMRPLALAAMATALAAWAAPAAAQGQGYGVGEWNLVSQGGASVCHVVLSNRFIPEQANFRAFVRGGARCTDWRARNLQMWVVRGNTLKLSDGSGREIAGLNEQNPNLYAAGEWALQRVGTGYVAPPGPGYPPSGDRPGQGYGRGEWNLIHQASGSVCLVSLTGRLIPEQNNYRAIARGGARCSDWVGQSVFMWVVRGNTLKFADASGRTRNSGLKW